MDFTKKRKKLTPAERLARYKKWRAEQEKNEDKNKDSAEKTPNWTKD